jgi:2-polyprenyl-3-methyl-5-hydroxy-6-metoxy-1,4-benzoquinol methylase
MIDRAYRVAYETAFRQLLSQAPGGTYDEMALPSYTHGNRLMAWLFWRRIGAAFALAGRLERQRVLDFGCGGAVTFKRLHACGCDITGVDPDARALATEISRRLAVPAQIVGRLDEVADRRFDCIFALDVLEHVDDLDGCIRQLAGALADGGRIVVSGPTENAWYRLGRRLAGFSGHYHVRSVYDIEQGFSRCGLVRTGLTTLRLPFALFRITGWKLGR